MGELLPFRIVRIVFGAVAESIPPFELGRLLFTANPNIVFL